MSSNVPLLKERYVRIFNARIIKYVFVHDDDKSVQQFQATIQNVNKKRNRQS